MTKLSATLWDWLIAEVRAGAAEEILPRFRRLTGEMVAAKSAPDDLVTEADRQMEQRLREACARHMPQALFLGEEAVSADSALLNALPEAELAIICDPVDGTWNFANGLAVFGVILAVMKRGEPVFGLLYDPIGDDWVMVERGAGTHFCRDGSLGERLVMPSTDRPEGATGFVPLYLFPPAQRPQIALGMTGLARANSLRCSCHEYRLLVQGKVDFNLSVNLQPWDHVAGLLAVTEAGGTFASAGEAPFHPARSYPGALIAAVNDDVLSGVRDVLKL